jgi:hypothetical protein
MTRKTKGKTTATEIIKMKRFQRNVIDHLPKKEILKILLKDEYAVNHIIKKVGNNFIHDNIKHIVPPQNFKKMIEEQIPMNTYKQVMEAVDFSVYVEEQYRILVINYLKSGRTCKEKTCYDPHMNRTKHTFWKWNGGVVTPCTIILQEYTRNWQNINPMSCKFSYNRSSKRWKKEQSRCKYLDIDSKYIDNVIRNNQKIAFLLGTHKRAGSNSTVWNFYQNPTCDWKNTVSLIFNFL